MYSLVSASVLALDLSRHPHGAAVADVVDRALAGGPTSPLPADARRTEARARLRTVAEQAPRMSEALRAVVDAVGASGGSAGGVLAASRTLQTTLLGRLDDLLWMLEQHLSGQDASQQVDLDVVLDRVTATWTASVLRASGTDLALLRDSWDEAVELVPPSLPPSHASAELLALLEAVTRCSRSEWQALERAHEREHPGLAWSERVHEASRAVVDAGRTVDVARWQMSAVRAAHGARHSTQVCAPGAMMSLVGAVQALCARDLLPASVTEPLLAPCREVLGLRM